MREYIAIDTETTGFSSDADRIIELGAVRFMDDGEEIDRFQAFCKTHIKIPDSLIEIHGITNDIIADAPPFSESIKGFLKFIGKDIPILAHNAAFDARMLTAELKRNYPSNTFKREIICTMKFAKQATVKLKSYSLPYLIIHYGLEKTDYSVGVSHQAIADCLHVKNLWLKLGGPKADHKSLFKAVIG